MEPCHEIYAGKRRVGDTRDHGRIEMGCVAVAHPPHPRLRRTSSLCAALGAAWGTTGARFWGARVPRIYTSPSWRRLARVLRRPIHLGNTAYRASRLNVSEAASGSETVLAARWDHRCQAKSSHRGRRGMDSGVGLRSRLEAACFAGIADMLRTQDRLDL